MRYAQIEKEALALTQVCEKFSMYLMGKSFVLETDHKPLISEFGQKNLDTLPPRVLRFCLRLMRYDYHITHVAKKALLIIDRLMLKSLLIIHRKLMYKLVYEACVLFLVNNAM